MSDLPAPPPPSEPPPDYGVLLHYQREFLSDPSPVVVGLKSRRIGLSWALASAAALHASKTSGANVYYMSYAMDMTKTFIDDVIFWAKAYNLAASDMQEVVIEYVEGGKTRFATTYEVTFASGHVVKALPAAARHLHSKGKPGEWVIIDEYSRVDDPAGIKEGAMAFPMWGGKVWILSTLHGADNHFAQLVEDIRAGREPYSLHQITLDNAITAGLYRRICEVSKTIWTPSGELEWRAAQIARYGEFAGEQLFCIPSKSAGRYIARHIVRQCMVEGPPVLRLTLVDEFATWGEVARVDHVAEWLDDQVQPLLDAIDPDSSGSFGQDFARSGHLSVLAPLVEGRDLVQRCPFLIEMRNVPHTSQLQVLQCVADGLPHLRAGALDARGNGSFLAEAAAQAYGFERIHQVQTSGAWYNKAFPKYRHALTDKLIEIPADSEVLKDHGDVELVGGVPMVPKSGERTTEAGLRHGDTAIALCLAWFASEQDDIPMEYGSSGRRDLAPAPPGLEAFQGASTFGVGFDRRAFLGT